MNQFDKLIPDLRDWNDGAGIDVESWIASLGNFRLAIGYSTIFWPRFVEYNGFVLREGFSEASLRELSAKNNEKSAVEALMNHLHIADIQHYECSDKSQDKLVYLGNILKEIYACKLKCQFPDKQFVVAFDDREQPVVDYQITFYQRSR